MTRDQLEHILRAASTIVGDPDVLVLGSQSILGSYSEDELPERAHASIEADVTFFDDYDNEKSDLVDMHIGEDSHFHATHGYYAQGVNVEVATLPGGWQDRVVFYTGGRCERDPGPLSGAARHGGRETGCASDEGHGVRRRAPGCRTRRR